MKKYYLVLLSLLTSGMISAQVVADYAVQIEATVGEAPAHIRLSWKPLPGATSYEVCRRAKNASSWGNPVHTGTDTFYRDNGVATDTAYEYRVIKYGGTITAYGYIYAGIKAPPVHNRGTLLLLVDSVFTDSCAAGIAQLMEDISGDGWQLLRLDISRTLKDTAVRSLIRAAAQTHADLSAVLLLGHIAVPYSGDFNPDGHADHKGAWPADVYYASINGTWTDASVNNTTATQSRNHNVPGDGKWDQSGILSLATLQVSRVDFHNMPAFSKTEVQLMQSYLNRLHRYKMDSLDIVRRALIDDNFTATAYPEAFAANGWRNFPVLTGRENIHAVDFISSLNDSSFQWAYGCGGGTFTGAGGIGNTPNFAANHVNGIFTMLFGSYFGDWDAQNSFLRAPLCSETPALTSCWAGRPNWHLHHMALGEHIGYATRLAQNNSSVANGYVTGLMPTGVHTALMGDLTLRTDYIKPAAGLAITTTAGRGAALSWGASPDTAVTGYYVYRSDSRYGRYKLISPFVTATGFPDTVGTGGMQYYMVRPVKKVETPSGTYFNLGIGITDTATVTYPDPPAGIANTPASFALSVYPNPVSGMLYITINDTHAADAHIRIMDIQGRNLDAYPVSVHKGLQTFSFPVDHLPAGMYILHMTAEGRTTVQKFLKQ